MVHRSEKVTVNHPVLIDSGADANLMSYKLTEQLQFDSEPVPQPLSATALDGRLVCYVTHQPTPVTLSFKDGHIEMLSFYLYHSTHYPLVLGYPWLKFHNPHSDWSMGTVLSWGEGCR